MTDRDYIKGLYDAQKIYNEVTDKLQEDYLKEHLKFKKGDLIKKSAKGRVTYEVLDYRVVNTPSFDTGDKFLAAVAIELFVVDVKILPVNRYRSYISILQNDDIVKAQHISEVKQ